MKSLELEKRQRELLYQETKVAMYHGKTIQNSALALMEQIDVIKLILDINKTGQAEVHSSLDIEQMFMHMLIMKQMNMME